VVGQCTAENPHGSHQKHAEFKRQRQPKRDHVFSSEKGGLKKAEKQRRGKAASPATAAMIGVASDAK
jgi:hypothetical protein